MSGLCASKNMIKTKICTKCKEEKELFEFYVRKDSVNGFRNECKQCISKKGKIYRENNKEKRKISNEKWRQENKSYLKKCQKEYYKNNRECFLEKAKEYASKHKKEKKEYDEKYIKKNKKKKIKKKKENFKERIKNDTQFRLRLNFSSLVRTKLRRRLLTKEGKSTFDFLPYTVDELKIHLENQFEPWMNWDNWSNKPGYWTIDHIKPDSSFTYTSVEDKEFQECWALSNLKPMEFIKNVIKSNKII